MMSLLLSAAVWLNLAAPPAPEQLHGRVVAVLLWRAGDPAQRAAVEELKRLGQQYRDGRVFALALASGVDAAGLREAVAREEIDFPVGLDLAGAGEKALGCASGCVALIGPDGTVASRLTADKAGALPSEVVPLAAGAAPSGPAPDLQAPAPAAPSKLSFPSGLAVDSAGGRVFVADTGHDRVLQLDARGKTTAVIGSGERGYRDGTYEQALFDRPRALALRGDALVVVESEAGRLRYVDLARRAVLTLDTEVLLLPTGVSVAQKRVFVSFPARRQVEELGLAPVGVTAYAGSGEDNLRDGALPAAGFPSPAAMAADGDTLYIADSSTGALRAVPLRAPDVRTVGSLPAAPTALAASSGTLYAALADGRLFEAREGRAPRLLASGLADPRGLAVLGGELLVAEAGAGRVARLSPSGARLGELSLARAKAPAAALPPPPPPPRRELAVTGLTVPPGRQSALRLSVALPPGWKLSPRAPFRYRVAEALGDIRFVEATRKAILDKPRLPAAILLTAREGRAQARLEVDYSYCPVGGGACRTDSARVEAMIDASSGAKSSAADITLKAP